MGVWQQDEAEEAARYRLLPGDWKTEDVDNNGKLEALHDKQFVGYKEPRYRLGFRNNFTFMENFNLSIFFRADLGHKAAFSDALRANGADTGEKRNYKARKPLKHVEVKAEEKHNFNEYNIIIEKIA